ncbi:hypothetical protein AT15_05850 [Kosmotoga arenicorallina S304]|uniref:Uncharacterized protein n=1 Tax=Kosmotoga arenicorallina S304 TaxID=1453497 RepID=A0A176K3J7_9BACT|nr:hypothetical protein [Kosmotoga arenicorallina]OAA31596.1 hypothetical protein AT15_05850 [Kosmotoga arenicorallina S304]
MVKEIFISKVLELLKEYSKNGCKLWLAECYERRWAYIGGYGSEYFLPPEKIITIGKFAIFGERVEENVKINLLKDIENFLEENNG